MVPKLRLTNWCGKYTTIYRVLHISTGAGFLPLTVRYTIFIYIYIWYIYICMHMTIVKYSQNWGTSEEYNTSSSRIEFLAYSMYLGMLYPIYVLTFNPSWMCKYMYSIIKYVHISREGRISWRYIFPWPNLLKERSNIMLVTFSPWTLCALQDYR